MTDDAAKKLNPAVRSPTRQVFVAYSYRLYPRSDYRKAYKEIEQAYDVTFIFADEKITNMHIMKKIETFIRGSDFSIFDISGWNPNVTLELGFAMAAANDQWYIAVDPTRTEIKDVPSDLRGIDRIEYQSYAELSEKLQTIITQRYSPRSQGGIEEFLQSRRREVVALLEEHANLTVTSLAQLLGVDVQVAKLIVRPLVENKVLVTRGAKKATRYSLRSADASTRRESDRPKPPRAVNSANRDEGSLELNDKERAVLQLLRRRGIPVHLRTVGATCFPDAGERSYSWARNSVRKLLRLGLIRKTWSGTYTLADATR